MSVPREPPLGLSARRRELLERLLQEEGAPASPDDSIRPTGGTGAYPMSFAQQRLWFLDQLSPGNPFYNVQVSIRHRGSLDLEVLERAFDAVVERHASLRTVFDLIDGTPMQLVQPEGKIPFEAVDLRRLPPAAREREAVRIGLEERSRPYDLARGPLGRIKVLRLADRDQVLLLGLHHIVADGWSMGVLAAVLGVLYVGFVGGGGVGLPGLAVQYADFAVWQRGWLWGARWAGPWGYGGGVLAGLPVLALPLDRPRPAVQLHRGAGFGFGLPGWLVGGLAGLARSCGATLFMVLLAGWAVVLGRWAGQEEVVVGAPIAGRNRAELEGLIGFFVNTLVLRVGLGGDPGFVELVGRVREVALGAYAHADVPFEKLVEELAPGRDLSRNPLFQVTFQLFESPSAPDAVQVRPGLELPVTSSLFDLRLDLSPLGEGLAGRVEFDTDLFERRSVEWLLERYRWVLEQVVAEPGRRLSGLSLLPVGQARLLAGWNATEAALPAGCVHGWVEGRARLAPDALAVADGEGEWTYRELNGLANRLARRLRALGVAEGEVAAVCLPRGRAFVAAVLAVLKAGGAYLPLDAGYPAARLAQVLADARPRVLVTDPVLVAGLPLPAGAELLCVPPWPEGEESDLGLSLDGSAAAYVIYTSGSTGAPKGVLVEHGGVLNLVGWHTRAYGIGAGDRGSQLASVGFDAAVWELWPYLCAGASVHVCDDATRADGELLLAWLAEAGVTVAFLPTPLAETVLSRPWPARARLRYLLTGGDTLRRYANPAHPYTLVNHYGPTEATVVTSAGVVAAEPDPGRLPGIGAPIANTVCYVVDQAGRLCGPGCPGELWIGGAGVARGYRNDPDLTAERFLANPFAATPPRLYKSGDLVRWQPDGTLGFLGRADEQVKIRGYRIEPREIETLLTQHPQVNQALVTSKPDPTNTPQLTAYITTKGDRAEDREAQVEHWRSLYEQTYAVDEPVDPEFDIRGWNSSYDGKPLGPDVMREQVDQTVGRIAALSPQRILEIGCGTGLLLFRLAPACARYRASDFSAVALERVRRRVAEHGWDHVDLQECPADEISDRAGGDFDVVVLNSVVQYFPDADYLEHVLTSSLACLRPGGTLFVGDVRNYALLEAFHTSVELADAPLGLSCAELRLRIRRRVETEQELVIDPAWFSAFALRQQRQIRVAATPRRGRMLNELTRFRYDAILTLDAPTPRLPALRLDWDGAGLDLSELSRRLSDAPLLVSGIPSVRLDDCVRARERLAAAADDLPVGTLRRALASPGAAVDPEDIWSLATDGLLDLGWHQSGETGRYDLVAAPPGGMEASLPLPPVPDRPLVNDPLRLDRARSVELRAWLEERLPEQMVPSSIIPLASMPLNSHGKVDVSALPAPHHVRAARSEASERPASETESRLASLWAETLGIHSVGVDENFFELGGDSILSIKLVSHAADAGLYFTTKQLFQNQTVAELARVVSFVKRVEAEQGPVVGDVPLTPIQSWFFEQGLAEPHHFNQAALLPVARSVNLNLLIRALHAVVSHHDALHLRFERRDGHWRQRSEPPEKELPVVSADLSALPRETLPSAIERAAGRVQAGLSLSGPLVKVALFNLGPREPRRLLIAIHHLAVDGVAWRILVEDLWRAYRQLAEGLPVSLPEKTSSFSAWAQRLREYAATPEAVAQTAFWLDQLPDDAPRLPRDLPGTDNRVAVTRSVRVALTAAETDDLLQRLLGERGLEINDVLLWALGRSLADWTAWSEIPLAVEAHGREQLFDDLDLTRTVGWFTSIFPLMLRIDGALSAADGPAAVAGQLRRIPDRGIGYGLLRYLAPDSDLRERLARRAWPEVAVNYLGRLDDDPVDPLRELTGPSRSPAGTRAHLLEVNGAVTAGRLQFDFYYSSGMHRESTVESIARFFVEELRAVLCARDAPGAERDLASGGISDRDLATVLSQLARDKRSTA